MRWASYDAALFDEVTRAWRDEHQAVATPIFGSDLSERIIEAARTNAAQAHVSEHISLSVADVQELTQPEGLESGLIFANPPFGQRMERSAKAAEEVLMERLASHFAPGWSLGVLLPLKHDPSKIARKLGLRAETITSFRQGGLPVKLHRIGRM
jgi:23S rRNA G2445 N2-methylase RlmL